MLSLIFWSLLLSSNRGREAARPEAVVVIVWVRERIVLMGFWCLAKLFDARVFQATLSKSPNKTNLVLWYLSSYTQPPVWQTVTVVKKLPVAHILLRDLKWDLLLVAIAKSNSIQFLLMQFELSPFPGSSNFLGISVASIGKQAVKKKEEEHVSKYPSIISLV